MIRVLFSRPHFKADFRLLIPFARKADRYNCKTLQATSFSHPITVAKIWSGGAFQPRKPVRYATKIADFRPDGVRRGRGGRRIAGFDRQSGRRERPNQNAAANETESSFHERIPPLFRRRFFEKAGEPLIGRKAARLNETRAGRLLRRRAAVVGFDEVDDELHRALIAARRVIGELLRRRLELGNPRLWLFSFTAIFSASAAARAEPNNSRPAQQNNCLTSSSGCSIFVLTRPPKEKAECPVPSKPFRLPPLASDRSGRSSRRARRRPGWKSRSSVSRAAALRPPAPRRWRA